MAQHNGVATVRQTATKATCKGADNHGLRLKVPRRSNHDITTGVTTIKISII